MNGTLLKRNADDTIHLVGFDKGWILEDTASGEIIDKTTDYQVKDEWVKKYKLNRNVGGFWYREDLEESDIMNLRKPVKSDWERTDMASGPIWDNGKYRIIEKSRDGTHDDITNYYILRDKENLSKDDVHFYTLEEAMESAEHMMSLESSRKITSARRGEVDSIAADELALCTENDGDLYRQMTLPVIDNLKKKMAKGIYDEQLALKAWLNVVTAEARKYVREFGSPGDTIDRMFNLATREEAAKEVARYYEDHLNQ